MTDVSNPHPYGPPVPCWQDVNISTIIYLVAKEWRIRVVDMLSCSREREVVFPRHVAMYLARRHTFCSLPMIGKYFGGRDHTTVLHASRKIARLLERDAVLAKRVARIEHDGKL